MKLYKRFCCAFFILSCSNDDFTADANPIEPSFIAIGENENNIYQYDFKSFSEDGILVNLSEDIDLDPPYITLREVGDVLTFYTFDSGNFSATQHNVETGSGSTFENFYSDNVSRSITWGTNSEDRFFLGFYEPIGSKNLNIKTLDFENNLDTDLFIENGVLNSYQPLYYNDKLFATYQDSTGQYHIAAIDTRTNSIITIMEFGAFSPSILIDDRGDLIIIENMGDNNQNYHRFDIETLESIGGESFKLSRSFLPGYLNTEFIGDRFYYQNLYVQPSTIVFGPAFYDFEDNTENIIDLVGIVADFQEEFKKGIKPISLGYDSISGSFLVGYGNTDNIAELTGGVLVISEKGELKGHVELPFVPTYFVKSTK